jgi:hypothetical protein
MRYNTHALEHPIGNPHDRAGGRRIYCDPITASIAAVGGSLIGSSMSANAQEDAANAAANAQTQAAQMGVDEQKRQFDALQQLLAPYTQAGTGALSAQQNLIGLNGGTAQQQAISALQSSPAFTSQLAAGENSILQNASATGGLRGGNTQAALAQYSPQLLAQMIQQQYANLGGLTSIGQNAAAGVGNAGMSSATNIANLYSQQGAAQAGSALAAGNAAQTRYSGIGSSLGQLAGSGAFSNMFGSSSSPSNAQLEQMYGFGG